MNTHVIIQNVASSQDTHEYELRSHMRETATMSEKNHRIYIDMAHTSLGELISPPNHYLKSIQEGLAEICKTAKCRSYWVATSTQYMEWNGEG